MKINHLILFTFIGLCLLLTLNSCIREDVGPYQEDFRTYDFIGFEHLEIGSAAKIYLRQGSNFSIMVRGDRRNLDDLRVRVVGSTLKCDYENYRPRKYANEYTITMPSLRGINFSGATRAEIVGFNGLDELAIRLSGASIVSFGGESEQVSVNLSGASKLTLMGKTKFLHSEASGASYLEAYAMPTEEAQVSVSGGSEARVQVSQVLVAQASGGSRVIYRGNPSTVNRSASGGSSINKE